MQNSFDSEELTLMARVVEKACRDIGGCADSVQAEIASKVPAYYADCGERDLNVLVSFAIGGRTKESCYAR